MHGTAFGSFPTDAAYDIMAAERTELRRSAHKRACIFHNGNYGSLSVRALSV